MFALTVAFGCVVVAVLLVTFGPWIPWVRDRLPSRRAIAQLEAFWVSWPCVAVTTG